MHSHTTGHDVTTAGDITEGEPISTFCPTYQRAMEILGRRWMGAVLRALMSGPRRYNEVLALVPGLSDPMLTQRLREMEAEGLVTRHVTPSSPVRVEYTLTEAGRELEPAFRAISSWAHKWLGAPPDEPPE